MPTYNGKMNHAELPVPEFFEPGNAGRLWRVPYEERARHARQWAHAHHLKPSAEDTRRVCLFLIDLQNTFCLPDFELFVAGKSGKGAVEDNVRLCLFIYRNLHRITEIVATMDTHTAMQIFHPIFWVDSNGEHPRPYTVISLKDLEMGLWRVNSAIAGGANIPDYDSLQAHALHYVRRLTGAGRCPLMIWPYHSMLGGVGHALVSSVEEALFFHCIARASQTHFEIKGRFLLTENYSALRPEVSDTYDGSLIAFKNAELMEKLLSFDAVIIAGQAKSHCVAWTVEDLLTEILERDPALTRKIYLLEDCTSPVVVSGGDFSDQAEAAFRRFAEAGMRTVRSTEPIDGWLEG